jgi:hypothetical protein
MILKSLTIHRRNSWDEKCNSPLVGEIEFKSDNGKVQINLSEDAAQKILALVAEGMVQATQELATRLTAQIIMHSAPALEHRSTDALS